MSPADCLTISRAEVCQLLGVSLRTFSRLREAGLAPEPIRGLNRWAKDTVIAFVQSRGVAPRRRGER